MSSARFAVSSGRFVWKEYRALRGLWLGVLVLGLLVDAAGSWFLTGAVDQGAFRFYVALAAATLYAAGAASVVFALEHEDETYGFLRGMPATWGPLYVGKVMLVGVSAVGLAVVLGFAAVVTGGFRTPASGDVGVALGVFGVGILESVAWGTLCSLVFRRPMAAAVATLVVAVLAVNLAVNMTNSSIAAASELSSYVRAAPLRLGIVAVVFLLSGVAARRWWEGWRLATPRCPHPGPLSATADLRREGERETSVWTRLRGKTRIASAANELCGRSGLGRVVWQSWRESWPYLPLPVAVWGASVFVPILLESIRDTNGIVPSVVIAGATMFFAPAMFGALAFSADQRRGQLRFFAERGARPRWVWLSRHMVWAGSLAVFMTFLSALAVTLVWLRWIERVHLYQFGEQWSSFQEPNLRRELREFLTQSPMLATLAFGGVMVAYAMGQACSMALRSEILAGFLAVVLAVVLSAWVVVLYLWELSGWVFLLPLATALLAATWLRAPAWIAGRNSWRAWWRPTAVVAAAALVTGTLLPTVRLQQVAHAPALFAAKPVAEEKLSAELAQLRREAEETAAMYVKAAEMLWQSVDSSGLQSAEAYRLAIEASRRPTCRFAFQLSKRPKASKNYLGADAMEVGRDYELVTSLLLQLAEMPNAAGEVSFEQLLAALRMNRHVMMEQPTAITIWQLRTERRILGQVAKWAAGQERTNDERRAAIAELQKFTDERSLVELALYEDARIIERVLNGKETSLVMATTPVTIAENLAFVANELPWERKRAVTALGIVTQKNVDYVRGVVSALRSSNSSLVRVYEVRRWAMPQFQRDIWRDSPAATSYLMSLEYQARVPMNELLHEFANTEAARRATLIRVALAAYRAEHGEYPEALSMLAPAFLESIPLDPFSTQAFEYQARGLELPLTGFNFEGPSDAGKWIPAGTPLLWSVGFSDLQLVKRTTDVTLPADENATASEHDSTGDEESRAVAVTHYSLEPRMVGHWFGESARELLFELPK